jgi:tetratricopeptide (TPR) repeat protein
MDAAIAYDMLRHLVMTAQFDDDKVKPAPTVRDLAHELERALKREHVPELLSIKAPVLLAEVWDYYGRFDLAVKHTNAGRAVLSELPDAAAAGVERELRQSKIRLAVAHGRSLYRQGEFDAAVELLQHCREYVERYLAHPPHPSNGTLGEIAYILGRIYRQLGRFESARLEFIEAISQYQMRAISRPAAAQFSAHKMATIAALGLAWCAYSTGSLRTALYGHLASARLLLKSTGDILNATYADVVHAAAVRALEGKKESVLKGLSHTVKEAERIFVRYEHSFYEAGAALEQGFIALALRNYNEALEICEDLARDVRDDSFRWEFRRLIVRSRALRHKNELAAARETAEKARKLAKSRENNVALIDALMVLSDTCKDGEAIGYLNHAIRLNRIEDRGATIVNPRVQAACLLNKVRHYLALNRPGEAAASFAAWRKFSPIVENASLHRMAAELEKEINTDKQLIIDLQGADGFEYKNHLYNLRKFLFMQAYKVDPEITKIADMIGESRQNIHRIWLPEFRGDADIKAMGFGRSHSVDRKKPGRPRRKT